jgi:hypothetical protein
MLKHGAAIILCVSHLLASLSQQRSNSSSSSSSSKTCQSMGLSLRQPSLRQSQAAASAAQWQQQENMSGHEAAIIHNTSHRLNRCGQQRLLSSGGSNSKTC